MNRTQNSVFKLYPTGLIDNKRFFSTCLSNKSYMIIRLQKCKIKDNSEPEHMTYNGWIYIINNLNVFFFFMKWSVFLIDPTKLKVGSNNGDQP